jgi:hypothetical protein
MIKEVASIPTLGLPLFVIIGIIGFLLMFATATIPLANKKLAKKIPMKYHFWLAKTTIAVAIVHGVLAASLFLGF